ncbi:MAG: hypothetical protein VX740_00545 [Pseudomonadota bacterium]|jgi:hypothetical protein|nr:hypothetical protein [Alphaproteobacteria bacterium]MEC7702832.1 hypothetical protein [Pseudomonadota bacterium]MED5421904.1 hypothetical protein [Pseudomonadota bacterium]MEE3322402.1 hypothetical protein [Pseudomonadota bacterium]|tara:strand:- start:16274 stop:16846 length:573 start_codon:yes stop_codon:yes gene_type:complete
MTQSDNKPAATHYNQKPIRRAEFIKPPNILKSKVGSGGLSQSILSKAQDLLENNTVDFRPLGEMYLNQLQEGIDLSAIDLDSPEEDRHGEKNIRQMLYPSMQLKANGGMFHYDLVTIIGDKLVQFLEVIERPDLEALEIVQAFHTTIRAVLLGQIQGSGGRYGNELVQALDDACYRYFIKYPDNIDPHKR